MMFLASLAACSIQLGGTEAPTGPPTGTKGGPTVTLAYQGGDGGLFSASADYRLMMNAAGFSGTPWWHYVTVGRDHYVDGEDRVLLVFNEFIGNTKGQVPPFARIQSATVELYAAEAMGHEVSVHLVVEDHAGSAGKIAGQAVPAPTWNSSFGGAPWLAGEGAELSASGSPPLDSRVVSESFDWVSFDVTAAVQAWVDGPDPAVANRGLLFTTDEQEVRGQHFVGGGADSARRPILTVTFAPPDHAPELAIESEPWSPSERAFVEGSTSADVVAVDLSVGGQPWRPAIRESATRWGAWVEGLAKDSKTHVLVRARTSSGEAVLVDQWLGWAVTELVDAEEVVLGVGETLLLGRSDPPVGTLSIQVDPGDGRASMSIDPGDVAPLTYPKGGCFAAAATFLGAGGLVLDRVELDVVSIRVEPVSPIASQVGHERTASFSGDPELALSHVALVPADPTRVSVQNLREEGGQLIADIRPFVLEPQTIRARVGGPTGRVIGSIPVHPFTLEHLGETFVGPHQVSFDIRVSPEVFVSVPTLQIEVWVFSDGTSFAAELSPIGEDYLILGAADFDASGSASLIAQFDPTLAAKAEFCRALTAMDVDPLGGGNTKISDTVGRNADPSDATDVIVIGAVDGALSIDENTSIELKASGGTPPYVWSELFDQRAIEVEGTRLVGFAPGIGTIEVVDHNGCRAQIPVTVHDVLEPPSGK